MQTASLFPLKLKITEPPPDTFVEAPDKEGKISSQYLRIRAYGSPARAF